MTAVHQCALCICVSHLMSTNWGQLHTVNQVDGTAGAWVFLAQLPYVSILGCL